MKSENFLRPADAATFLRQRLGFGAARTLAKLRVVGGGPAYRKIGRLVVYHPGDLIAWAESKLGPRQHSTSETPLRPAELVPTKRLTLEKRVAEPTDAGVTAK